MPGPSRYTKGGKLKPKHPRVITSQGSRPMTKAEQASPVHIGSPSYSPPVQSSAPRSRQSGASRTRPSRGDYGRSGVPLSELLDPALKMNASTGLGDREQTKATKAMTGRESGMTSGEIIAKNLEVASLFIPGTAAVRGVGLAAKLVDASRAMKAAEKVSEAARGAQAARVSRAATAAKRSRVAKSSTIPNRAKIERKAMKGARAARKRREALRVKSLSKPEELKELAWQLAHGRAVKNGWVPQSPVSDLASPVVRFARATAKPTRALRAATLSSAYLPQTAPKVADALKERADTYWGTMKAYKELAEGDPDWSETMMDTPQGRRLQRIGLKAKQ